MDVSVSLTKMDWRIEARSFYPWPAQCLVCVWGFLPTAWESMPWVLAGGPPEPGSGGGGSLVGPWLVVPPEPGFGGWRVP